MSHLLCCTSRYQRSGTKPRQVQPRAALGERCPVRAVPFTAETPPAREALAQSRALKGTGAAGVATVGAAGVEVAQEDLAEAPGAILPLMAHLANRLPGALRRCLRLRMRTISQAALSVPMPEIACTRLSSDTSAAVNSRMTRPWYMATILSETCSTSGISELITMTA